MTTLRVLFAVAPEATRADAWALYDAHGALVQEGHDVPAQWPKAEYCEAVIAAAATRLVALVLPPMASERVAAAAQFAIEDQLAGPAAEHALAIAPQRSDGTILVAITSAALVAALNDRFSRVIAEPALAPVPAALQWCWYAAGNGEGFVRTADGSAFAVSSAARGPLPAELALALEQATRGARPPQVVTTAFAVDDGALAQWAQASGVAFRQAKAWRWQDASPAAFAAASDLSSAAGAAGGSKQTSRRHSTFRYAAIIACAALLLHVIATVGQWGALRFAQWQTTQELAGVARALDLPDTDDAPTIAARVARLHAAQRHRAGKSAEDDALPLLARAAPGLAALPNGTLRSATFADAAWTFDLAKLDSLPVGEFEQRLALAGLATLKAPTPSGLRIRATLATGKS